MNIPGLLLRATAAALLAAYLWLVLPGDLRAPAALAALVIAPLYLVAHALRAVRLFLVLYDGNLRLRDALFAHVHASGVSALIPFKLGELYRILMVHSLSIRLSRAMIAIWIERVFDALLVAGLLALLALVAGPGALTGNAWFVPALAGFLFASILFFLVLPENLVLVKRHLILKHNNAAALAILQLVDALHRVLADASRIWRTRFATMLWLSLGIWALEVGCVLAAVAFTGASLDPIGSGTRILTDLTVRSSPWTLAGPSDAALACYRLGTVDLLVTTALILALLVPIRQFRRTSGSPFSHQAMPCA